MLVWPCARTARTISLPYIIFACALVAQEQELGDRKKSVNAHSAVATATGGAVLIQSDENDNGVVVKSLGSALRVDVLRHARC